MKRLIVLVLLAVFPHGPAGAEQRVIALEREHNGVLFMAAAQNRIGWMRLKGHGVARDYAKAARWLEAAAAQKNTLAYYNLARMNQLGLGRAKDHAAAARLYRKAADKDHIRSQYRLGWYLYRGIGLAKDYRASAKWVGKAAVAGHAKSQHSLGWMHFKGNGVKKDPVAALAWYRKAARQGYPDSQARLGWLYLKGIGAPRDIVESHMWYSLAAVNARAAPKRAREGPPEPRQDRQNHVARQHRRGDPADRGRTGANKEPVTAAKGDSHHS